MNEKDIPGLTEREQEVLKLLEKGWSNKKIASSLYITNNTVKYHLRNIYQKLGVQNRIQAVVALQNKLK